VINLKNIEPSAFGPVPSRRLGRSLGINNIPAKTCSYSCVYCQLGKTTNVTVKRRTFSNPKEVFQVVKKKVDSSIPKKERIDYLSFVPDGEPTLDLNLGEEISLLRDMRLPIAVITNASLIWQGSLREDLLKADYVSLKIDALDESLWRRINRPHMNLKLDTILEGITEFVKDFKGTVTSETMLIGNIDYGNGIENIARYLRGLRRLDKVYIATPTRPPTEKWVRPAKEETINAAFQLLSEKLGVDKVELLVGYEGNEFTFLGNVEEDLLSIMAVHPMRKEAIEVFLKKAGSDWQMIERLSREGKIVKLEYGENEYYMLKLPNNFKSANSSILIGR